VPVRASGSEEIQIKDKESFRPDDDVRALLKAANSKARWKNKSELMNAAIRAGLAALAGKRIQLQSSEFESRFFSDMKKGAR
jgi:hypothetical protein